MIIPTLKFTVQPVLSRDVFGQPKLGKAVVEWCAPVKLNFAQQNSTVRTDSSATHGHAMEPAGTTVILVTTKSRVALDSVLVIMGNKLRVTKVHPRYTVGGQLDHYEVECQLWV